MWVSKVSQRGGALSTSVPRALCRELGIERGDLLIFTHEKAGEIVARKLTPEALSALRDRTGKKRT